MQGRSDQGRPGKCLGRPAIWRQWEGLRLSGARLMGRAYLGGDGGKGKRGSPHGARLPWGGGKGKRGSPRGRAYLGGGGENTKTVFLFRAADPDLSL